ncbi:hypothetical protein EFE41_04655 [Methanohalophilus portucalensis FDF-1]|uniref:Uncharacterized protein n=2 Tax=Methanohalophilus portucalensis TaxID=39664 RepID=A0A3M9LDW6_9EURY|nr:hypothetical protein BKM01_02815 [Methanohalophilus portucalensis]RNI11514.1 hypothetical protein EFE41_04655 [Methanohalophilus portucalensis FDF-1]
MGRVNKVDIKKKLDIWWWYDAKATLNFFTYSLVNFCNTYKFGEQHKTIQYPYSGPILFGISN